MKVSRIWDFITQDPQHYIMVKMIKITYFNEFWLQLKTTVVPEPDTVPKSRVLDKMPMLLINLVFNNKNKEGLDVTI
jgi:hypothetical protein